MHLYFTLLLFTSLIIPIYTAKHNIYNILPKEEDQNYESNINDDDNFESEIENPPFNEMISNLKENWNYPLKYLQKRGYTGDISELDDLPREVPDNSSENETTTVSNNENTTATTNGTSNSTTANPTVVGKIKNIWNKIVHPAKPKENGSTNALELYDAINEYLNENKYQRSVNFDCSLCDNCTHSIKSVKSDSTTIVPLTTTTVKKTIPSTTISPQRNKTNLPSTALQNLQPADIDFLRKFINCLKSRIYILDEVKELKNASKLLSNSTIEFQNLSQAMKNDSNLLQNNSTSGNRFDNKLKFLAHLHHPVYNIGKKKNRGLDLKEVQKLIDDAKATLEISNASLFKDFESQNDKNYNINSNIGFMPYLSKRSETFDNENDGDNNMKKSKRMTNQIIGSDPNDSSYRSTRINENDLRTLNNINRASEFPTNIAANFLTRNNFENIVDESIQRQVDKLNEKSNDESDYNEDSIIDLEKYDDDDIRFKRKKSSKKSRNKKKKPRVANFGRINSRLNFDDFEHSNQNKRFSNRGYPLIKDIKRNEFNNEQSALKHNNGINDAIVDESLYSNKIPHLYLPQSHVKSPSNMELVNDFRSNTRADNFENNLNYEDAKSNDLINHIATQIQKRSISDELSKQINDVISNVDQNSFKTKSKNSEYDDYSEIDDENVQKPNSIIKGKESKEKNNLILKDTSNDDYLSDYKSLKSLITPEQDGDLNQFMQNLNSPPQQFTFDVEHYVRPTKTFSFQLPSIEETKPREYFKFNEQKNDYVQKQPGQYFQFNDVSKQTKRDILTQRIKAISTKMKKDLLLNFQPPTKLDNTIQSKRHSSDDKIQKSSDDFVDHYYLLNDGKTNLNNIKHENAKIIDPVSIDIDLDLDKKFRDLKYTPPPQQDTILLK